MKANKRKYGEAAARLSFFFLLFFPFAQVLCFLFSILTFVLLQAFFFSFPILVNLDGRVEDQWQGDFLPKRVKQSGYPSPATPRGLSCAKGHQKNKGGKGRLGSLESASTVLRGA
ncbi:hypothetical protein LX36DRAFT_234027 [Colletotrichum falcatum]|nr:hypothetical protein LX36DRAFT_234027 [Colletotrichum falcatum]